MAKIKSQIEDDKFTGKDSFNPKADLDIRDDFMKNWARNKREESGISSNHFTDSQISLSRYNE